MPSYLIIDGYNAISKIRELEAKKDISLEASRLSFIRALMDFMLQKRAFDKIFLVFDSSEKELGIRRHSYGDIEVIFATGDNDADAVIVSLLRKFSNKARISVSSDDNFVRNHSRVYGATPLSIKELEDLIMLKKKPERSKIKEKDLDAGFIKDINEELKRHWRLE
jgi:predicted RNA-binding protein with PIN domain